MSTHPFLSFFSLPNRFEETSSRLPSNLGHSVLPLCWVGGAPEPNPLDQSLSPPWPIHQAFVLLFGPYLNILLVFVPSQSCCNPNWSKDFWCPYICRCRCLCGTKWGMLHWYSHFLSNESLIPTWKPYLPLVYRPPTIQLKKKDFGSSLFLILIVSSFFFPWILLFFLQPLILTWRAGP